MKKYYFLILILLNTFILPAQQISVNATIDTNAIVIGDQIKLKLELQKPENAQVLFPQINDTIIKEIEIVEEFPVDTVKQENGAISLSKTYTITSFDSGFYQIPPLAFTIVSADSDTIATNPVPLAVYTVKVDTSAHKIADIKAPYEAPLTFSEFWHEYFIYILSALFIIILLIAVYWYYRKTRKTENGIIEKQKPREPAHIIAIRRLNQLKDKKLWQNNKVKEYYSELTDIIREYMIYRFGIDALEMTSSEILQELKQLPEVNDEMYNKMRYLLTTADFVKFAKAKPLPDEHDTCMKNAIFFVENTKPVEETKNKESDNKADKDEADKNNTEENNLETKK